VKHRRRKLAIVAAAFIALVAVVAVVVHLPGVQRSIWNRLAASIEEGSGWQIATDDIALRALPARLQTSGITVAYEGRTVVRLDRLEARWRWLGVLRPPYKLESLTLEGVNVDSDALPEIQGSKLLSMD